MSFREKSAWICLFITLVVFGPYFLQVFAPLGNGVIRLDLGRVLGAFIGATILQVVLSVVFHIALAIHARNELPTSATGRSRRSRSVSPTTCSWPRA